MIKNTRSSNLLILIGVYAMLYLLLFIVPMFSQPAKASDFQISTIEKITVPLFFILFLAGIICAYINEKIGGIIILFWHLLIWIFSMMFWPDAGMALVMALPAMFIGVFFIRNWYKRNDERYKEGSKTLKLTLQILLINYALIYLVIVISHVSPSLFGVNYPNSRTDELVTWDYLSAPGLILLISLIIFMIGFVYSWKRELIAGILFLIWYILIVFTSFSYLEFSSSGPWFISGLVIFIQGVFYLLNFYKHRLDPAK